MNFDGVPEVWPRYDALMISDLAPIVLVPERQPHEDDVAYAQRIALICADIAVLARAMSIDDVAAEIRRSFDLY